jgi:iron(III) transport system ATP-binding protein
MRITAEHLTKRFGTNAVVGDVGLSIEEGELFTLLGPSGCGKTTLLRLIAGFYAPDEGEIRFNDRVVNAVPPHQRGIGMVFQNYALWPHMTVSANVAYGLKLRKVAAAEMADRVEKVLEKVKLGGLGERYPGQLSGGQQQRVALARALAHNPVVLLLDEPFSNLDPDMASKMRHELHSLLKRTNTTTILVTHDHEEAFTIADRIAVLHEGRLEQLDTPEMIYHLPATRFVADFVGYADFLPGVVCNGQVTTELGDFPNHKQFPAGTPVVVMIRPDDIRISPDRQGEARILSRQFRGSENLYAIQLHSGQIVHCSEESTAIYQPETAVSLKVFAMHTVIFSDSGP